MKLLKLAVVALTVASVDSKLQAQYMPRRQTSQENTSSSVSSKTRDSLATLVYDARLREFRCWSEGMLTTDFRDHLCDPVFGWHTINSNLYFVRGQSITLVVINAVAEDIFTLDIKADDLAEPQVPISGALTELPKLQPIPAAPSILPGTGAVFVSGNSPIEASSAYRLALTTEEVKDFRAWIQANIVDPLNTKEVLDALATDIDSALAQVVAGAPIRADIESLTADLKLIDDMPNTLDDWIGTVRRLVKLIDRDSTLRSRLVLLGVTTAGSVINSAAIASRSTNVQRALAIDPADLASFANTLSTGLGNTPYALINSITVVNRQFHSDAEAMAPLINALNQALGGADAASVLARAKANLNVLAENSPPIQLADTRRQELENIKTKIENEKASDTGVYALQKAWTAAVDLLVRKASSLNAVAKSLPLQAPFDILPIGQWFSSKTVTLTVKQGQRIALFDIGGVADATRAGITGGDTPSGKGTQVPAADLAAARVIQFPIYNLYRLKIGLGFLYSTADDNVYKVDKVTSGSSATAVTQQFIDQTRDRDYNLMTSVNVMIFPWARHAFPWRPRYDGEARPSFYKDFGAMMGFSVTNPTRDFLFGGAWFPRMSSIGLQVAWHLSLRDYPEPGTDITQPIPDRVIALKQTRVNGLALGLVFTTDFFTRVFAPIFKP
jgi:hypothetical protein